MIISFEQFQRSAQAPAGVTIIGSGPAAIAVALTLDDHGVSSVLLESGDGTPKQWDISRDIEDPAHKTAEGYSQLHIRREIGGGFNVWGAWSSTMRELNFSRTDIPDYPRWPFAKASLRPYFERACSMLRIEDPDHCWHDEIAVRPQQGLYAKGFCFPEPVRFPVFEPRIRQSSRITLVTGATVEQAVKVEGDTHVLRVSHGDGRTEIVRRGPIVCAGGGLGNARFLARSGPSLGLAKSVTEQIGFHATEHPHCYGLGLVLFRPEVAAAIENSEGKSAVVTSLIPAPSYLIERKLTDFNFQILPANPSQIGDREKAILANYRLLHGVEPVLYQANLGMEQVPQAKNRVLDQDTLSGANDGYLSIDFSAQRPVIHAATQWLLSQGVHAWIASEDPKIQAVGHIHGTTRMGRDAASGVVDSNARVFGTDHMYMAGSSIFPNAGFPNPTMNLVTLAIKLGDHLAGVGA